MLKIKNRFQSEKQLIGLDLLKKLAFEIGTISKVTLLTKAKKPSYEMDAIFGSKTRKSCGQFVRNYKTEDLLGKQVFALTNLLPVRIAGIKSEYLTLGFPDELNDGQAIGISPKHQVSNGTRLLVNNETSSDVLNDSVDTPTAQYEDFQSVEVKSATIIDIIKDFSGNYNFALVDIGNESHLFAYLPGKLCADKKEFIGIQVPIIVNVELPFLTQFFDFNAIVLCASVGDENQSITLLTVDKPVKNGLNMF